MLTPWGFISYLMRGKMPHLAYSPLNVMAQICTSITIKVEKPGKYSDNRIWRHACNCLLYLSKEKVISKIVDLLGVCPFLFLLAVSVYWGRNLWWELNISLLVNFFFFFLSSSSASSSFGPCLVNYDLCTDSFLGGPRHWHLQSLMNLLRSVSKYLAGHNNVFRLHSMNWRLAIFYIACQSLQ